MCYFKKIFMVMAILLIPLSSLYAAAPDWSQLNTNHGFVYDVIKILHGNYITQWGGGAKSAAADYSILSTLGWWACWAGLILAGIVASVKVIQIYRLADDPSNYMKGKAKWVVLFFVVIAMLCPLDQGGSFVQKEGAIHVPLLGDAFANMVYKNVVKKMLVPPKLAHTDVSAGQLASKIFEGEVCSYGVQAGSESRNKDLDTLYSKDGKVTPIKSDTDIFYALDDSNAVIDKSSDFHLNIAGKYDQLSEITFSPKSSLSYILAQAFSKSASSACGSINFPDEKTGTTVFEKVAMDQSFYLKKAVVALVNDLAPAARIMQVLSANKKKIDVNGSTDTKNDVAKMEDIYNNAIKKYNFTVSKIPERVQANVLKNDDLLDFIDDSGWGLGVLWFKLLADTQSSFIQNANHYTNSMSNKTMPVCDNKGIYGYLFGTSYCIPMSYYDVISSNVRSFKSSMNDIIVNENKKNNVDDITTEISTSCGISGCSFSSVDNMVGRGLKTLLVYATDSQVYNQGIGFDQLKDIIDPNNQQSIFDVSAKLGASLSGYSASLFSITAGLSATAGVLDGSTKTIGGFLGLSLASGGVAALLKYIADLTNNAAYMIWIPASTLMIGLPFVPLVIWGVLLLSYFIMLIEAYIALPLSTALWVVDDQAFRSGRVTRTVMMISALFLRPFLFVVGLVSAYILAPISLMIWNIMFFWGMSMLTTTSFLTSFFLVSVYAAGLLKFTMITYNVAFIIPDKILQWMGSGFGDVAAFGSPADFNSSVHTGGGGGGGGGIGSLVGRNLSGTITEMRGGKKSGSDVTGGSSLPTLKETTAKSFADRGIGDNDTIYSKSPLKD